MDNKLITDSDKLFKDKVDNYGDTMPYSDIIDIERKFSLYTEGYRIASKAIYEYCIKEPCYQYNLIYPFVFNCRQFLELIMKEIITLGYGYEYMNKKEKTFSDNHDLQELWKILRSDILQKVSKKTFKEELDRVEKLIHEFNSHDPKSMFFRYPLTKAPKREESTIIQIIDIENFYRVFDKLSNWLNSQWVTVYYYREQRSEEEMQWRFEFEE